MWNNCRGLRDSIDTTRKSAAYETHWSRDYCAASRRCRARNWNSIAHTRGASLRSSLPLVLHSENLPGLPHQRVSLSFFRIPSLRAEFLRRVWKKEREREREQERARGSFHERSPRNTTVVRDNDNQRVKWGLISFGCGRVERDANESGGCVTEQRGGEGGRKIRVYTCQETRRLVHNIGGSCADSRGRKGETWGRVNEEPRREERMWLNAARQGHKNVLSTPAPPVIGSNHRGSHASSFLRSRKTTTPRRRCVRNDEVAKVYDRRHLELTKWRFLC